MCVEALELILEREKERERERERERGDIQQAGDPLP